MQGFIFYFVGFTNLVNRKQLKGLVLKMMSHILPKLRKYPRCVLLDILNLCAKCFSEVNVSRKSIFQLKLIFLLS